MSEPVTQAEIEDVLSSIRRLVSEDSRADNKGAREAETAMSEPATSPQGEPSASDVPKSVTRLVLTPALRVNEAGENTTAEHGGDAPAEETRDRDLRAAAQTGSSLDMDPSAESEDPAPGRSLDTDSPNADMSEDIRVSDTQSAPQSDASDADAPRTDDLQNDDSQADAPWKDPWATLYQAAGVESAAEDDSAHAHGAAPTAPADRVSAVVKKITELEAKVARSKEQWEPDGRTAYPFAGASIETLQWQDHSTAEGAEDVAEDEALDRAETTPAAAAQQDHEVEAAFHHHQEAGDHDAVETQEDHDLMQAALEATGDDLAADVLDSLSGEDAYLDEESLREMVADIVRQELQGALGERITRNVRKLVRREIHRALAAHDLL